MRGCLLGRIYVISMIVVSIQNKLAAAGSEWPAAESPGAARSHVPNLDPLNSRRVPTRNVCSIRRPEQVLIVPLRYLCR